MKNIYMLIIGMVSMLSYSCIKQDGNEFKPNLPDAAVSGFNATYSVYTNRDILNVNPIVQNESDYDYVSFLSNSRCRLISR